MNLAKMRARRMRLTRVPAAVWGILLTRLAARAARRAPLRGGLSGRLAAFPRGEGLPHRVELRADRADLALAVGIGGRRLGLDGLRLRQLRFGGRRRGARLRLARVRLSALAGVLGLCERLRLFIRHDDVAALERRIVGAERFRPALPGTLAAAGRIELLAVFERIRELLVGRARKRHGLRHVLAGIAVAVQRDFGCRAHLLTCALVLGKFRRYGRERDREEEAVAGAHANGAERRGRL